MCLFSTLHDIDKSLKHRWTQSKSVNDKQKYKTAHTVSFVSCWNDFENVMKVLCLCSICIPLTLSHPCVWTHADLTGIITLLAGESVLNYSLRALPFEIIYHSFVFSWLLFCFPAIISLSNCLEQLFVFSLSVSLMKAHIFMSSLPIMISGSTAIISMLN